MRWRLVKWIIIFILGRCRQFGVDCTFGCFSGVFFKRCVWGCCTLVTSGPWYKLRGWLGVKSQCLLIMVRGWTRAVGTRSVAISRLHNASHRCATLALLDKLSQPWTAQLPAATSIFPVTHKYANWGRFYAMTITTANSGRSRPNSFSDSWCL